MNVRRMIVHQIVRNDAAAGGTQLIQSDRCVENNAKAVNFVTELNLRYRTIKQSNGQFRADNNPFFTGFDNYRQAGSDNGFVEFTRQVMPTLQTAMAGTAAKGGYLVFADYNELYPYIGLFLIRNRQGSVLNKGQQDTTFAISETEHIDFEHLAMACRINMQRYLEGITPYITFINTRSVDSVFFQEWIGVTDMVNNKVDTQNLYNILRSLPPPMGENNEPMESTVFLNRVYTDIKNAPRGAEVDLQDIGRRYYNDENMLTQYAEEQGISLNYVFTPDNSVLRKFVNIKVKADNIDLNFPQSYLDDERIILQADQGRIVINSPDLIAAIQAEFGTNNG